MKTIVNSYNLYDENNYSTILYHAVAEDEEQVKALADEAGYCIDDLVIALERKNVRDQLGNPYEPYIDDALIH